MQVAKVTRDGNRVKVLLEGDDLLADVEMRKTEQGVDVTLGGGGIRVTVGVFRESAIVFALAMMAALLDDEVIARVRQALDDPRDHVQPPTLQDLAAAEPPPGSIPRRTEERLVD